MSYEGEMLKKMRMPAKKEVEEALLKTLIKHNGTIKEFATGEEIVEELADLSPSWRGFAIRALSNNETNYE